MKLSTKDLQQTKRWLNEAERAALIEVIRASFANIEPLDYLAKYFDNSQVQERKLRLYFSHESHESTTSEAGAETLVGYCLLTFKQDKATTVIQASAAFLPEYRKGSNTFQFSLLECIKYWLRRPWRKTFYADTMLSPAMYRAIAKHTGIVWPHYQHQAPSEWFERFNPNGVTSAETKQRCLVEVDRSSNYSDAELQAFYASKKREIAYYLRVNPAFNQGMALFVIIPVNFKQCIQTAWKMVRR